MARSRASAVLLVVLGGCTDRSIELSAPPDVEELDLAVPVARDLSMPLDAAFSFDGPKRHLGESCANDDECLSGQCLTAENTRGEFDNVCGATCDKHTPCIEGVCLSYDFDVYWCLLPCEVQKHSSDCLPAGFECCENGTIDVCVSPAALTCMPL